MSSGQRFVVLDLFEGPLDLLLHLVKEQQLDIFSVDLHILTVQYLEFLRQMNFADLRDAGSFVQMAAYLVQMKSASLLPDHREESSAAEDAEQTEGDEEARFRRRMYEYSLFQQVACFFEGASAASAACYLGHEWRRLEACYSGEHRPWSGDPAILLVLYEQMLTSLPERKQARVTAKSHKLAIQSLMERLQLILEKVPAFRWQDCYPAVPSRYVLVAGVVSLLQLAKENLLELSQEEVLESLWVMRLGGKQGKAEDDSATDNAQGKKRIAYNKDFEDVFRTF